MDRVVKMKFYSRLTYAAIFAVPVAPAFWFGWAVGTAVFATVAETTQNPYLGTVLGIVVGLISAFGLEAVGIISGHVMVKSWGLGEPRTAVLAATILLAYVGLGISGLMSWLNVGVVMFIISPLVYVLAALQNETREKETAKEDAKAERRETRKAKRRDVKDLQILELTLEHERELEKPKGETTVIHETKPATKAKRPSPSPVSRNDESKGETAVNPAALILEEWARNLALPESERITKKELGERFINPRTGKSYTGQGVGVIIRRASSNGVAEK